MRIALAAFLLLTIGPAAAAANSARPNVLIVITDDQGFGDLGVHGNPVVQTPHLDRLAKEGVRLTNFYVSPVCSPTRASLLTGRYNYRTGVVDTFLGRSLMHADEVTLAEMLKAAGYRTGIFGKWHLGDNHPLRPIDQGFDEALVLKGGGLGQPSDLPGGSSYFDPILLHNGKPRKTRGYVSDVIGTATADFIATNRDRPFFAYLAFNAPHTPLTEVPQEHYERYRAMDLTAGRFAGPGWPLGQTMNADAMARVYAMVSNIDENVGRVLAKLREVGLEKDTIVVFLTDNGPQQPRFNGGMRGLKGTPYDGGVRVPCFIRWPAGLGASAGRTVDRVAAHVDMAPTLLAACGVTPPPGVKMDGINLLPLLTGKVGADAWPDRTIYVQWHRGEVPQRDRSFAARSQRWKLVQPAGTDGKPFDPRYELYDLSAEAAETRDVAAEHPEVVEQMRADYRRWFDDVTAGRDLAQPPRIHVGTRHENPVRLTRQDWRGPRAGWGPKSLGHWEVETAEAGQFEVTLELPAGDVRSVHVRAGGVNIDQPVQPGQTSVKLAPVPLPAGPARFEAWATAGGETVGVRSAAVLRPDVRVTE